MDIKEQIDELKKEIENLIPDSVCNDRLSYLITELSDLAISYKKLWCASIKQSNTFKEKLISLDVDLDELFENDRD